MLHYLYPLKEVFIMRTTKKTILTSKWKSPIGKVMGWAIPSYITTKTHCVPCICEILCNMKKLAH